MMSWVRKYKTICSKHDYIESVLCDAVGLLGGVKESEKDLIDNIIRPALSKIEDARVMVDHAKDDGQKMETGLSEKRKRIDHLEEEVASLTQQLESAREDLQAWEATQ